MEVEPVTVSNPLDNDFDVSINGSLTFVEGLNTPDNSTFKIYFDKTPEPLEAYESNDNSFEYSNLDFDTKYYWRVETVNSEGVVITTSPIWSFTTEGDSPTIVDDIVQDIDGNTYETVEINGQVWLSSNLKVTRYPDGTPINYIESSIDWSSLDREAQAFCWYNNDISNKEKFGALYTYYAAINGNSSIGQTQGICPDGWHIPSKQEWTSLSSYLNSEYGISGAGGALKESGFDNWIEPNQGATNQTGFNSIPGGRRTSSGDFDSKGRTANYFIVSDLEGYIESVYQYHSGGDLAGRSTVGGDNITDAYSCRCIKN